MAEAAKILPAGEYLAALTLQGPPLPAFLHLAHPSRPKQHVLLIITRALSF